MRLHNFKEKKITLLSKEKGEKFEDIGCVVIYCGTYKIKEQHIQNKTLSWSMHKGLLTLLTTLFQ
jgi:hypothetical protein